MSFEQFNSRLLAAVSQTIACLVILSGLPRRILRALGPVATDSGIAPASGTAGPGGRKILRPNSLRMTVLNVVDRQADPRPRLFCESRET